MIMKDSLNMMISQSHVRTCKLKMCDILQTSLEIATDL